MAETAARLTVIFSVRKKVARKNKLHKTLESLKSFGEEQKYRSTVTVVRMDDGKYTSHDNGK